MKKIISIQYLGSAALVLATMTTVAAAQETASNTGSVAAYVDNICPDMARLSPQGGAESGGQQLFVRCRAIRAADASSKPAALGAITSEELLAQDAAIRGAAQSQTASVAARISAMGHFAVGTTISAMLRQPIRLAGSDAVQSDAGMDYGIGSGQRLQTFSNISYSGGNRDANSLESGFDMDFGSITAGMDYRFTPEMVAGIALGYGKTRLAFDGNGGALRSRALTLASYAMIQPDDRFEASILVAYSDIRFRGRRDIDYAVTGSFADAVDGAALSTTKAHQLEVSVSEFYNLGSGAWTVGPALQLSWTYLTIDAFREVGTNAGSDSLAFAFPKQNSESLQIALGLDVSKAISTSSGIFSPYARVRGIVEAADQRRSVRLFYVNDPFAGAAGRPGATLTTSATDRTRLSLGGGIVAQLRGGLSLMVDGQTLLGLKDVTQYGLTVGLRFAL